MCLRFVRVRNLCFILVPWFYLDFNLRDDGFDSNLFCHFYFLLMKWQLFHNWLTLVKLCLVYVPLPFFKCMIWFLVVLRSFKWTASQKRSLYWLIYYLPHDFLDLFDEVRSWYAVIVEAIIFWSACLSFAPVRGLCLELFVLNQIWLFFLV